MISDAGIVTACDANYFPGLLMLYRSVQESYPCPVACYDLGLTPAELAEAGRHSDLHILPLPDDPLIDRIKITMGAEPPLAKQNKRVWPLWICPWLIKYAPFRDVIWMDCDLVVLRGLAEFFEGVAQEPIFTPENKAPQLTPNRPELYDYLPINRPFDPLLPTINAGVSGWRKDRDAQALAAYRLPVRRAIDDARIRDAISWHDQGALIWAIQSCGLEHCVAATNKWNLCLDHTSLARNPLSWDENFLERTRAEVPDANVLHWNGSPPPWTQRNDLAVSETRENKALVRHRMRSCDIACMTKINVTNSTAELVAQAIDSAAQFLRAQLRAGNYGLESVSGDGSHNHSDNKGHIFVASFISEAMRGLFDEIDRTIVLMRILSEEIDGLWGYNAPGPRHLEHMRAYHVDADDSAFVLRTLRLLGVNRPPERLLRFHRAAEGLFVTFDVPGPAVLVTKRSHANTLLAHPEVNANVFLALEGTHLDHYINLDVLVRTQHELGFWESYFYPSPFYCTLLAVELLGRKPGFETMTGRALSYVASSQQSDGSWGADGDPYETALAVACLCGHSAYADPVERGVRHLLATISSEGSWASPACIWDTPIPQLDDVWRGYDRHGSYITARCMIALRRAAPQLMGLS